MRDFIPSLYSCLRLPRRPVYRLGDWLSVFGIALAEVARLQAALPALKTSELDTRKFNARIAPVLLFPLN